MIKKFLLVYLLSIATALAGLPPTTLSGQSQSAKKTTFNFKTPYNQSTQTNGIESLIETGNENMFVNPGFEGMATLTAGLADGWLNSLGTPTLTTTAGEFSSGKQAQKIALTSQILTISQTISTPLGIQKQGVAGIIYRVPSNVTTFTICTRVDSVDQTCVPSANLINDDKFHSIEIPITFGSATAGLVIKTASAATANIYLDGAYLKQGLGFQNLALDVGYSATVTSAGVISNLSKPGWLSANCSVSATSQFDCPVQVGLVTTKMNCTATSDQTTFDARYPAYDSVNSTNLNVRLRTQSSASGAAAANAFILKCDKSGADYLAASSSVYSQASANYSFINAGVITIGGTITAPTKGTTSADRVFYSRSGQMGKFIFQYQQTTAGAVGSGDYLWTLPAGLSFDTSIITPYTTTPWASGASMNRAYIGTGSSNNGVGFGGCSLYAYDATRFRSVCQYGGSTAATSHYMVGSTDFSLGTAAIGFTFNFEAPIAGWSTSPAIVGSFAELGIKAGTSQNTTSGTSIDFTGIPAGVKRVTVMFAGMSANGNSGALIQLGAGSITTSGYVGGSAQDGAATQVSLSTGFRFENNSSADLVSGQIIFSHMGGNIWIGTGWQARENGGQSFRTTYGRINLAGALDRIRLTNVNGTDTFDAGSANISWEF